MILAYPGSMEERRATPRQRVFKAGSIEFDGSAVDCVVRNLSPAGAGLEVDNSRGIPHYFTLKIPTRNIREDCRVVWRVGKQIGLAFEQAA